MRFRPIMMTTMAALFGTLPIALGSAPAPRRGARSAWRSSGGLLVSQSLTLFVTPVVYTYMESLQNKLGTWLWFLGGRERKAAES